MDTTHEFTVQPVNFTFKWILLMLAMYAGVMAAFMALGIDKLFIGFDVLFLLLSGAVAAVILMIYYRKNIRHLSATKSSITIKAGVRTDQLYSIIQLLVCVMNDIREHIFMMIFR